MNRREFNTLMAATVAGVFVAGKAAFAGESKDDKDGCKGKDGCKSKGKAKTATKGKDTCKAGAKAKPATKTPASAHKPAASPTPKS